MILANAYTFVSGFGLQTGNRAERRNTNKMRWTGRRGKKKLTDKHLDAYGYTVKASGQQISQGELETFVPQKIVRKSRLVFKNRARNKQNSWITHGFRYRIDGLGESIDFRDNNGTRLTLGTGWCSRDEPGGLYRCNRYLFARRSSRCWRS